MDTYVEYLVKAKSNKWARNLHKPMMLLSIVFALIGVLFFRGILLGAVVSGSVCYWTYMNQYIEYEYYYFDGELSIDKILNKSKRKKAELFQMELIEIITPMNSINLVRYNDENYNVVDYSSCENQEYLYVMIYEGRKKVYLTLSEELVLELKKQMPFKIRV